MLLVLVIVVAGVYVITRFRKQRPDDISFYDYPEDLRDKKRILIGSDVRFESPVGPGECGINNDVSINSGNQSYEETGDQGPIWKANMNTIN